MRLEGVGHRIRESLRYAIDTRQSAKPQEGLSVATS